MLKPIPFRKIIGKKIPIDVVTVMIKLEVEKYLLLATGDIPQVMRASDRY